MDNTQKSVLLVAMPFAGNTIPSIQLQILEDYLKQRNINVKSKHLYLKATEIYGLENYNLLINPPNDSYNAQILFTKYVFPEHWIKNKEKNLDFFNKKILRNKMIGFEKYCELTDNFYDWSIKNLGWENYDLIGFTLNYGQLLPSLSIAKKIKTIDPNKKIILGGSRTVDKIGINILKSFEFIDFIVSGDGEEALYLLASDFPNYNKISRLIYKDGKDIIWNKSDEIVDINNSPLPDFDSFYNDLSQTSEEIQQYFALYGKLPIEISRGCWWNKCSFCNLNIQHQVYREKNPDKIIEEIVHLSEKYKILSYQLIGNTLPRDYRTLIDKIKNLGKDYTFFVEARAGFLKSEDYKNLKEAGFTAIQTGIETFSPNYIKKMNKGTRVIDNVASLKYCKENGILNSYNLIINYPNEEAIDFEETNRNIQLFKYLEPPQISHLIVGYGSPIFKNPKKFNIKNFENTEIDKILFTEEILKNCINFFYSFKTEKTPFKNDWENLVNNWKNEYEKLQIEGVKTQSQLNKLIFYYLDGEDFIKIFDKRNSKDVQIYILDEIERTIFLSCIDVISSEKLNKKLSFIPDFQLAAILHSFEKYGIVYKEKNYYLSLPIRCYNKNIIDSDKERQKLVYITGNQRSL